MEENLIQITSDFYDGTIFEDGYGMYCHKLIASDINIPATTLGIYYYISSYLYNGKREAFPTQSLMSYHLSIGVKALRKHIKTLESEGYIVIEKVRAKAPGKDGKANHTQNLYYIVSNLEDKEKIKTFGEVEKDNYIEKIKAAKQKKIARQNIKRRALKEGVLNTNIILLFLLFSKHHF